MDVTFSRHESADYLTDEARIVAYLVAIAEEADPALTIAVLALVALARNMALLARDTGLTREGICKALAPDGNPGVATVVKIAHALGLRFRLEAAPPAESWVGGGVYLSCPGP